MLSVGTDDTEKTDEELAGCGYEFCLAESSDTGNDTDIPNWQRYTMASIYLLFALLSSVIIALFLDPVSR